MKEQNRSLGSVEKITEGSVRVLLQRFVAQRFTGRIILRRGAHSCSFFLSEGVVVQARTNVSEHRLGEIFKSTLGLDERDIQVALQFSRIKNQPIGMVLLGQKKITAKDLYRCLVSQVEMIAGSVVEWDSGIGYVHPGAEPEKEAILLRVSLETVIGPVVPAAAPPPAPAASGGAPTPPPGREEAPPAPARAAVTTPREEITIDAILQFIVAQEAVAEDDFYSLLGVGVTATGEEIRKAYHQLIRRWHPDRVGYRLREHEAQRLHRVFARINAGFEILGSKEKRETFDRQRREALAGRPGLAAALQQQEDAASLFAKAQHLLRQSQYSQAIEYLQKACRMDPGRGRYHYFLGGAYYRANMLKQAEESLLRAIQADSSVADYYVALGRVYKQGGMPRRAEEQFDRALRWEPSHGSALKEKQAIRDGR
jgi:curved DNA-binding protein CbpA